MRRLKRQTIELRVELNRNGYWPIDREFGKTLMCLVLRDRETGQELAYYPTHDDCEQILRSMLTAEAANDEYQFAAPANGPKRPPQLAVKIQRIRAVLSDFKPSRSSPKFIPELEVPTSS